MLQIDGPLIEIGCMDKRDRIRQNPTALTSSGQPIFFIFYRFKGKKNYCISLLTTYLTYENFKYLNGVSTSNIYLLASVILKSKAGAPRKLTVTNCWQVVT